MGVAGDAKINGRSDRAARAEQTSYLNAEWRGYINVNLTASEKDQARDWMATIAPWEVWTEAVRSGCVVSVKLDGSGGGFLASITQRRPGHVNVGLAVTARAAEVGTAVFRALYLVDKLGLTSDWASVQGPADPDRW